MRIAGALLIGLAQLALLAIVPLVVRVPFAPAMGVLLVLLCLAAGAEAWVSRPDPSQPPWLARASALALLVGFWLALCGTGVSPSAVALGATLVVGGIVLRVAAIVALGEAFVSAHRLAPTRTDGLYGVIRHPSETGQLLLAFGAAVMTTSWAAFGWWALVLLPLTMARVRDEERLLFSTPAYRHYRARVPAFLPLPWTSCAASAARYSTRQPGR